MNVLVIDTSSWIDYFRGSKSSTDGDLESALGEGRAYITGIISAELISGVKSDHERNQLISFMRVLPQCETDLDHWLRVGDLRRSLSSKGLNISIPDTHIAQCVLDLEGYLVSKDLIFNRIAEIVPLRVL